MIPEKSLVIHKNRPALVTGIEGEKINIAVSGGGSIKVREKDVELVHPGPCTAKDLEAHLPQGSVKEAASIKEAWELLENDDASSAGLPLKEFAELLYGDFSPASALAAWGHLSEGLYFTGDMRSIKARPRSAVETEEKKRIEKQRETEEREAFLEKLRKIAPNKSASSGQVELNESGTPAERTNVSEGSPPARRFLYDVEALARGQTDKSRTLKELGRSETPQEAHRLLLAAGVWPLWENPHPYRFGLSLNSSKIVPDPATEENRLDLSHLTAYAIDNAWSNDPDDAVSLEGPDEQGLYCLWVHVADPASSVIPGSPADIEARNRGATLYLPEGNFLMLAAEAMSGYVLDSGAGKSLVPALSFKMLLNKDNSISDTSIFPSVIRVTRMTYEQADNIVETGAEHSATLARLFDFAERNLERRLNAGAVTIELPETHIHVEGEEKKVSIESVVPRRSADMVRECMLLAGEACSRWAIKNRLPFPFISQEEGELPPREEWLNGLAGCWQLRRCMRPRSVSVKPGVHWGLGLDEYSQVTSPLRRYTDLLCHQQIRAFLRQEPFLNEEELTLRLGIAEAAASAAAKAERASRQHWLAVYLLGKKDSSWEGIILDFKGSRAVVIIPELGVETQLNLRGKGDFNEKIDLVFLSANIPEGEILFAAR